MPEIPFRSRRRWSVEFKRRVVAEALAPGVAGHQDGAPFVALAEDLEQELGAGLGQRHEAEFVDNQQPVFRQLFLEAQQVFLVTGLHQFVDQSRRRGEPHR